MNRIGVTVYDTVMITGLGPVGLGGVMNGVYRGARVIGVDNNKWRAQYALKLGAAAVVDPTESHGFSKFLISRMGAALTMQLIVLAWWPRTGSALMPPGVKARSRSWGNRARHPAAHQPGHDPQRLIPNRIVALQHERYATHDADDHRAWPRLDPLVSHRFPLDQIQQAWETQVAGECAKVLLKPWA